MAWAGELMLLSSPGEGLRLMGLAAELCQAAGGGALPTTLSLAQCL